MREGDFTFGTQERVEGEGAIAGGMLRDLEGEGRTVTILIRVKCEGGRQAPLGQGTPDVLKNKNEGLTEVLKGQISSCSEGRKERRCFGCCTLLKLDNKNWILCRNSLGKSFGIKKSLLSDISN